VPGGGPDPFRDTFVAIAAARAVIAATRLGLVQALAARPATAAELAAARRLDLTGCEALLCALQALGYLTVDTRGAYRPTPAALKLVPGRDGSAAHFIGAYNVHAWEMLGSLERTLADPSAAASHATPAGDGFWDSYIRGLYELSSAQQERNAALVPLKDARALLDVAGGAGGFAMAMCRRFPALHATVLELPASAAVGRRIVQEQGFAERVGFREGDALADPLGEQLDVISMFNLLHHLAPAAVQRLLARARCALRGGGVIVIGETERADAHAAPSLEGAMSGLVYFASSGTRNYSQAELTGWLRDAGFAGTEVHRDEDASHRLLYVAIAPAS
jgi:SAM-dependent methyltransferase